MTISKWRKMGDPTYRSPQWRRIRELVLQRDNYRCVICGVDISTPGAARVDHIRRVRDGGAFFDPANLRSLCVMHDNQGHAEKGSRSPTRQERFTLPGCDVAGLPVDPAHPWKKR
jgi:5-methylcytosine-specific restriction protein A